MKLDLLLVHPGSRLQVYQSLGRELAAVEPPVWAGLIASYARGKGLSVAILDAEAEGLDATAAARRVADADPTLVAIVVYGHQPSASTQNMPAAGAVCSAIKALEPERRVLLVGGHVAALPERTMQEEETDFVCSGEGPATVVQLTEALNAGGTLDRVRGLWYREGRALRCTPPAPLVRDLDGEMPEVAWDLLPMERYRAHNWHCFGHLQRQPYASLYTTLGCPFHCSFCCIQSPFKNGEVEAGLRAGVNSYRHWSPERVLATLDRLVRDYGVRNLKLADEMFVLTPRHVLAICDGIIERGYDLNIWAYARVDTVKERMLPKLRQAGFRWLAFGIEAADEEVRRGVDKAFGQELVYRTVEQVRAAGIDVIGNYIFGLPEDDAASMRKTLEMALELNCEFANFYCAMAYPGSKLYQMALAERIPLPEKWSGYSQHAVDTLPLATRHLTGGEVLRFRDEAFHEYFSSGPYLQMIERRFGPETVAHLRGMTGHRLERLHA